MTVAAINNALSAIAPLGQTEAVTPDIPAQQRFAELLNAPQTANAPDALFSAQGALNELTVGAELTAKVAGSLTQSINKLVNIQ